MLASRVSAFTCRWALMGLAVAVLLGDRPAAAQLTTAGQVYPTDDPFTFFDFEGLYGFVETLDPPPLPQFFWEGTKDVTIGEGSFGSVRISQAGFLNFQHLVLGGTDSEVSTASTGGTRGNGDGNPANGLSPDAPTSGFGIMRIEDYNSYFNNHPLVIPSVWQNPSNAEALRFPSQPIDGGGPRSTTEGYDAYIGLSGSGELRITAGGRAEIQDAVVVGFGPEAVGHVEVSGLGSYLAAYGGLNPNAATPNRQVFGGVGPATEINQMIIGAYGQGSMTISDGARVDAFYGAAIGVTRSDGQDDITRTAFNQPGDPLGSGRVIVDGAGSTWNVSVGSFQGDMLPTSFSSQGGALAIGQFKESPTGLPDYDATELGQGYLSIRNGGFVNVTRYTSPSTATDDADLRIGRLGTLDFRGGQMLVRDQLVSDGLIQALYDGQGVEGGLATGGSHLNTGTFENRKLGKVRIGAGQTLSVLSHAEAGFTAPDTTEALVGANYGLIEAIGDQANGFAEFSYERNIEGDDETVAPFVSGSLRSPEVFYNAGELSAPGQIVAQNSQLRFRSGLWNSGNIAFVGGQNIVSGRVMNAADPLFAPLGTIAIANKSDVVFEDAVTNDGTITISDDSNALFLGGGPSAGLSTETVAYHGIGSLNLVSTNDIHVAGNFALGDTFDLGGSTGIGGTLRLAVEDFARDAFAQLVIEGDADFDFAVPSTIEFLELAPPSGIGPSLVAGDEFEFITVLGIASGTGTIIVSSLPSPGSPSLAFVPEFEDNVFSLVVVEDHSIGADTNGDGIVDDADLAAWRQFHGLASGASGIHGDVDLDGDVDTNDYAYILQQFGGAGVAVTATVPEPGALVMLSMLGLVAVRRRNRG
jgi:hypothetical protein